MTLGERTVSLQQQLKKGISEKDIPQMYQELKDVLIEHNKLYYQENAPIISDEEYDFLFAQLKEIEKNYPHLISSESPTQRLIGQLEEQSSFKKVYHKKKLWSLENSYNESDLKAFDEKIRKVAEKEGFSSYQYFIEPKYDGLSVELIYEKGKLIHAITRWDGDVGEDITQNVKTIQNLPHNLQNVPYLLSVRGEIMMKKSVLAQLNAEREKTGKDVFANTRNAASWSVKLLDIQEVSKRNLQCFVYELLYAEDEQGNEIPFSLENLFPKIELFSKKGTIDTMIECCLNPDTKQFLEQQDYDFDGLVIKLEDQKKEEQSDSLRMLIWTTNHHPKRAIAYKFPAKQVETQIESVDFQIGRTGLITPVANLLPVKLSGVEISRVSLHNFDFILQKDIRIHDYVWIQRSGEVIPYVTGVIKQRRVGTEDLIEPPLFCPQCNEAICKIEGMYYCTNLNCKAQLKEKIKYFVSKECMNILWIGESLVDLLVEQGIFKNIADVYKIGTIETQIFLRKLPGFWEKRIEEIVKELDKSKKISFWRLINALGIPNIGKKMAQDIEQFLAEHQINSLDQMAEFLWNEEKMRALHGIGEKTMLALKYYFSNEENQKLLKEFQKIWISFVISSGQKNGESFSITWTFPYPREMIVKCFQEHQLIFHEQPKKTTNVLFCGDNPWSKKKKAEELNIPILSREEIVTKYPFVQNIKEEQQTLPPKKIQQSLF